MIRAIIATAMRLRVIVVAGALLLLLLGADSVGRLPLDVFPEFAPPIVEIQTEAPGLSADEVEALVSVPLESTLQGTPWLDVMRSKSVEGLSSIVLVLEQGADLFRARQLVQERLAVAAARLPQVSRPPVILSPLSATSRVMKIGMSSASLTQMELSALARWTVRPRLMAVPGVANVAVWGQRDRELQALVDPDVLHANGVTLDQVVRAAGEASAVASGGFVETENQRFGVRHAAHLSEAQDLAKAVVVDRGGSPVLLGDVAEVVEGHPPVIGDAVVDDGPGILLIVEKEPWGNTLGVTRGVEAALEALAPGLTGVKVDPTIFRPATFIETALSNLSRALWIGCVLVVLVLLLFLGEWRTALISALAIPLSLVTAILVLSWRGLTIDTMVLAGLVIALGEVVDDAIIDVENIVRRLRLHRAEPSGRSTFRVVLEASLEVRSAVVIGSLIVALVLVPVFFLHGLTGAFFRPLAGAYILAILASLLVALTITPALAYWLLPSARLHARESPVIRGLKRLYAVLLPAFVSRPRLCVALAVAGPLAAALAARGMGEEFLPHFRERDLLMHWVEKPGTSHEAMLRITERASRELRAIAGVRNFGAHIGRAEVADEVVGIDFTELWISLDPAVDYDATVARVQEVVDGYPGLYRDLLTYLRERIKEVLTGASATIVVRLFGPDLEQLGRQARAIGAVLAGVEGVVDLKVEPLVLIPRLELRLRPEAAARFGLTAGAVRRAVTTLVAGSRVGQVFENQAVYDVRVWGTPEVRRDLEALRSLRIDTPAGAPGGASVPLGDVADVRFAPTPNAIRREGASRRIDVTCNVGGRDLGSVARDIQSRLDDIPFEHGYHAEVLGEYAEREAATRRILLLALLSLAGIFLVLHADFRSTRVALLVLLALPFALAGGVFGAFLGGGVLSLGSIIGFVTVVGIAVRNAIMLLSHYRHLQLEEGLPFGDELVLRGAAERLAPILMTAAAATLALLPLIVAGNVPGQEIELPLAVVILGGLVTSTLLNLFVLPGLYRRFAKRAVQREDD